MKTIIIENARFMVNMGPLQSDYWGLCGNIFGHPSCSDGDFMFVSTPKEFDKTTMFVKTCSGRTYQIASFEGSKEKTIAEIEEVIRRGGYSRC